MTKKIKLGSVIVAGGQARRMGGGFKGARLWRGQALLSWVYQALKTQEAGPIVVNCPDAEAVAATGFSGPVIGDDFADHGPLAGVLAGLDYGAAQGWDQVLSVPCDVPCLPSDLVARLQAAHVKSGKIAYAHSGGRDHPLIALWSVETRHALRADLVRLGALAVGRWINAHGAEAVAWSDLGGDPFFNANRPQDLENV